jgi:fructose/tagatose bisphosphate aldolase
MANFSNQEEVRNSLQGIIELSGDELRIKDKGKLRRELIDKLVFEATFSQDEAVADFCRQLIRKIAVQEGIILGSVYEYYLKKAKDKRKITVPAINIRGMAYNTARAVFEAVKKEKAGIFILEIAKSEIGYTAQKPKEYAASVLAAAIKEEYKGPLYLQGDHFQMNAEKYKANPDEEREKIKKLIREAVEAGFYQIDLDMSTLVDFEKENYDAQQALNCKETAILTVYVRDLEKELGLDKAGIVINLGGEIGEIGKGIKGRNSSIEDLKAFMRGYSEELNSLNNGRQIKGITKIAVQSGTQHGGIRDEKGVLIEGVKVSFNTLAELGQVVREEYGLAGVVQHGASTLDPRCFVLFVGHPSPKGFEISEGLLNKDNEKILSDNPVAEVHLATAYQDTILDHPDFPEDLAREIKKWVLENFPPKEGEDPEKSYINNRKNAWGPFKLKLWSLPGQVQDSFRKSLVEQFSEDVFENLGVKNFRIN